MQMRTLTFDIGGANVKRLLVDYSENTVKSDIYYFPIWQREKELLGFLKGKRLPCDCTGVTMTAELSDVFRDKKEGVEFVVAACERAFKKPFYLTVNGELLRAEEIKNPLSLAASNWMASLYYLEKKFGEGILLDVGSTTTDILPFGAESKRVATDLERLQRGQLVYTGYLRTPISAVVAKVPFRGRLTRIAAEYFGITADVYNVLGMLEDYSCEAPDKRGKTPLDSMRRISRLLCADLEEVGEEQVREICNYVFQKQAESIAEALLMVLPGLEEPRVYICGVGMPLAAKACEIAGVASLNLASLTPAHDNLPCLGLAEMLKDLGKV